MGTGSKDASVREHGEDNWIRRFRSVALSLGNFNDRRMVIDDIVSYITHGQVKNGLGERIEDIPHFEQEYVLLVLLPGKGRSSYLTVDSIERIRPFQPLMPLVEEANISGRITPKPLISKMKSGDHLDRDNPVPEFLFAFTNLLSFQENLADLSDFIRKYEDDRGRAYELPDSGTVSGQLPYPRL